MLKASKNYKKMSDSALDSFAGAVLVAMTGNTYFTPLAADVAVLQDKYDNYTAALKLAVNGSREQKAQKNTDKAELISALDVVCDGVNPIAKGNSVKLYSSGFKIVDTKGSPVVIQPLKKFTLGYGPNEGTVVITAQKGRGTVSLMIEYTIGDTVGADTVWSRCNETKNVCTIEGLTPGHYLWARATSVGRRNQILFTSPIKIMVV